MRSEHQRQHEAGAEQQQGRGGVQALRRERNGTRAEHQHRHVQRQREQRHKDTGAAHPDG